MLRYKKPAFWVSAIAGAVVLTAGVLLMGGQANGSREAEQSPVAPKAVDATSGQAHDIEQTYYYTDITVTSVDGEDIGTLRCVGETSENTYELIMDATFVATTTGPTKPPA